MSEFLFIEKSYVLKLLSTLEMNKASDSDDNPIYKIILVVLCA